MKGQTTIEFVGSLLVYLLTLITVLTAISGRTPGFNDDVAEAGMNMEKYRVTNQILSSPGHHDFEQGGENWQKNLSTVNQTTEFGLAESYHVLDPDKIRMLSTSGPGFNYSQFRDLTDLEQQYNFNFTVFPVVATSQSFTRTQPPSNPPITEPAFGSEYDLADNRVHYGSFEYNNTDYRFLVTSHNGVYDNVYISNSWDFSGRLPNSVGETRSLGSNRFEIVRIQNRRRTPGSSVVLRRHLKSFGPTPREAEGTVTKLNRYASLGTDSSGASIVRMEVLSW